MTLFISTLTVHGQAETEPNGTVAQTGTQTISSATTITGNVCLGTGCPASDPTDFWIIADGSSGTFIATWSSNVSVRLFTYPTAARNTAPTSVILSSGMTSSLSSSSFYSISCQFVSIGVSTPYSVALSGTALPAAVTPVSASITAQTNVLCNSESTGSLTVTAVDGTTPYSYAWSSGGSTVTESTLAAGTYTVTVTDANGVTTTASSSITEPAAILVIISSVSNVDCYGGSNGSITSSVTGGVPPYTYNWNSGETISSITNKPAGTYTVYVKDANGCGDAPPP